jgi:small-conductance mechanosensitive channel
VIETIVHAVGGALGLSNESVRRILGTLVVVVAYVIARRVVTRLLGRRFDETSTRYRFNKGSQLIFLLISFAILFRIWFQDASGIGTWLGLLSAGVAVALQDPLVDLAGWLYFVLRRPFRVGDRIQIGSHAGDVVDVHLFTFTLLEIGNWVEADQSTGRLIHVPNGWMFKQTIAGYDQGFPYIWNEIPVTVTFESDWREAKRTLEAILADKAEKVDDEEFHRASEMLHIQFTRLTPVVWVTTAPEGVKLVMRYLCPPRARRVSTSSMWEEILDRFAQLPAVDFAYPTARRFDQSFEGKPALRASSSAHRPRRGLEPSAEREPSPEGKVD